MNFTARIAAAFDRSGVARDAVVGGAALPVVSRDFKGTGAPSRLRAPLAALTLILALAAFAVTAASASAAPLRTTTPVVSEVSYASAHVSGNFTSPGCEGFCSISYAFQYSKDPATEGWKTGPSEPVEHAAFKAKPIAGVIEGLEDGTEYSVRLVAWNGFLQPDPSELVTSPLPNPTFTTLTAAPASVEATDNASEVEYTQARATGKVNRPAKSNDLTCKFEYLPDETYANNPIGERFNGATPVPCEPPIVATVGSSEVKAKLTNLSPATTYHLRLVVSNAAGPAAKEAPATFTTQGPVPPPSVISTDDAAEVEYSRASLSGEVSRPPGADPSLDATCNFEYITDTAFNDNPSGEEFLGAAQAPCETEPPTTPGLVSAPGTSPVTVKLAGLSLTASTTYHLRLSVSNAGGTDSKEAASTFTTEGPVPKPIVLAISDSTEVGQNSATFAGEVQRPPGADPAIDVNCRFEYISDEQFSDNVGNGVAPFEGAGQTYCAEPITSPDPGHPAVSAPVEVELGGLKAGTTYHLRLVAENNLGNGVDTKDAAHTFTTLEAEIPLATLDPVAGGTFTTAHLNGTIDADDPGSSPAYARVLIEVSTDGKNWIYQEGWRYTDGGPDVARFNEGPRPGEANYANLQPGTTYYFRIGSYYERGLAPEDATALGVVAYSAVRTMTTEPVTAPTPEDLAVAGVTPTSAHFAGIVNPNAPFGPLSELAKNAYATKWTFQCTPECMDRFGNVIGGTVQGEEGAKPVAADLEGLVPNTHYEVSLIAKNGGELEATAGPVEFDTPLIKPTTKALPGGSDGEGGYILEGVVNPNNSEVTDCRFEWGPTAPAYAFKADCSPSPGPSAKPVTVEAHLTGLTPGATYHVKLIATNAAGTEQTTDRTFVAALADKGPECSNEARRQESGSLALPECRAYELVTAGVDSEGNGMSFNDDYADNTVAYVSSASNISNSGIGDPLSVVGEGFNTYVARRTVAGWETIPNLNGPPGTSPFSAPEFMKIVEGGAWTHYSEDYLSSVWVAEKQGDPSGLAPYLRTPDGRFHRVGTLHPFDTTSPEGRIFGVSADLSHIVYSAAKDEVETGPGVYEFVGTGNDLPSRVDLDNSGSPISDCNELTGNLEPDEAFGTINARAKAISTDGSTIVVSVAGGCGGDNPPTREIWARVGGIASYDVSASRCTRTAADPGGACNAPAEATFEAAAPDGSRVFFTTAQQLVNGDVDQTKDIYACDLPPGNPAPAAGKANSCSAFRQISVAETGAAEVEKVLNTSEDGSTILFTARGVLAANEDPLKEQAVAGDNNLYVWRSDAAHPAGQTAFLGRIDTSKDNPFGLPAQSTADGRYVVFTTRNHLVETDTDSARDVYRYDSVTGEMVRISTGIFGTGGNGEGEGFDASIPARPRTGNTGPTFTQSPAISAAGDRIVFTTKEALSPLDGNDDTDLYLWSSGHVYLISGGSVGNGGSDAAIDDSGKDIYFDKGTAQILDARIGGGFEKGSPPTSCSDEACQPSPPAPPLPKDPGSAEPGPGNPLQPRRCSRGKVRKHGKCVKKSTRTHPAKKHHAKTHKRADSNTRGGK